MTLRKLRQYSFTLYSCRLGDGSQYQTMTHPLTREVVRITIDPGLSKEDRQAVRELLAAREAQGPDDDGYWYLTFPGRTRLNLGFGNLKGKSAIPSVNVELTCSKLGATVLSVLIELAEVANLAFRAPFNETTAFTRPVKDPLVRARWPQRCVFSNAVDLESWLTKCVGASEVNWPD